MKNFFRYIFYKAYHFSINVWREKEFPYVWAASAISFIIIVFLLIFVESVVMVFDIEELQDFPDYYKYISIGIWVIIVTYYSTNGRYLTTLNKYKDLTNKQKKRYRVLSILCYIGLFIGFIVMTFVARALHG